MSAGRATILGRALSGVAILFLAFDAAIKFALIQPVRDTLRQLGWPSDTGTILGLAIGLAIATLLYAIPRTAFIGAVLLTGYLGGAIATHARIGSPLATHTFFGIYVAVFLWGGLYWREPRLRALIVGRENMA
jgi:hypothetical protein